MSQQEHIVYRGFQLSGNPYVPDGDVEVCRRRSDGSFEYRRIARGNFPEGTGPNSTLGCTNRGRWIIESGSQVQPAAPPAQPTGAQQAVLPRPTRTAIQRRPAQAMTQQERIVDGGFQLSGNPYAREGFVELLRPRSDGTFKRREIAQDRVPVGAAPNSLLGLTKRGEWVVTGVRVLPPNPPVQLTEAQRAARRDSGFFSH